MSFKDFVKRRRAEEAAAPKTQECETGQELPTAQEATPLAAAESARLIPVREAES